MPLPCPSGQISLADIQNEFGGSNPISISEYYRNGGLVPSSASTVPVSGQISFSNFFCAANEIVVYITQNSENVNVQSLFGSYWTQNIGKRLVINPGVIVGSPYTWLSALFVDSGASSTVTIDNYGSIQGAGGPSGLGGGVAIIAISPIRINNQGSIYGGGGGGGRGGNGGAGYYVVAYDCTQGFGYAWRGEGNAYYEDTGDYYGSCNVSCSAAFGDGAYCGDTQSNGDLCCGGAYYTAAECFCCYKSSTCYYDVYTSGGEGGPGGQGQGYGQNLTAGGFGTAGEINAGSGGIGGSGGSFGNQGITGNPGGNGNAGGGGAGDVGGLPGNYIQGNSYVTWITDGDRRGGVLP